MNSIKEPDVTIIGAGFTGLTAGYELSKKGYKVRILEAGEEIGGLAAAFDVGGEKLDRFYHHWFTNDEAVMSLIDELELNHLVVENPTNTGMYYANNFFKLSTPWDLLNFTPLSLLDRIRLGFLALKARRVKNWKDLENKTAEEWLIELGGQKVYEVVWQPLLKGKFGPYAEKVSAVWFWNKLKLRGGSRGKGGEERLAYFTGGFISLANHLADQIRSLGGEILLNQTVVSMQKTDSYWSTQTTSNTYHSKKILATPALPIIAELISDWAPSDLLQKLRSIDYIGNVCLVLELKRPLSDTYWLNVNDPAFPFVGVIEHTNFESAKNYGGRHIVYLSKYLPHTDRLYSMNKSEFLDYAIPYLQRMFPDFTQDWLIDFHLWKARWSQPVVVKHYSELIPPQLEQPDLDFFICSMAQIYPEDRGTNYAIREGRKIAAKIARNDGTEKAQ